MLIFIVQVILDTGEKLTDFTGLEWSCDVRQVHV